MAVSSWKEKVADKLSRLLADSPSSPSQSPSDSPVAAREPEAVPFLTEGLLSHQQSSLSSYMTSFLQKTSSALDRHKSGISMSLHGLRHLPVQSLSAKWKRKSFSMKDTTQSSVKSTDGRESPETIDLSKEKPEAVSKRVVTCPSKVEETSTSNGSEDFLSALMDESTFISSTLFEFLQSSLPNIVKGCRWVLLYSTLKHGISFRTLVRKSADLPGPCLLVVGDKQGAVFGGLLDSPLKPTAKRKYQGTNQTFLFTTIYGEPRLFRATGENRFYYLCLNDMLAFGGGGNFALYLDEDLLHGTSGPCDTFGNICLAHSPEFELKNVELWGFTHISRYLCR